MEQENLTLTTLPDVYADSAELQERVGVTPCHWRHGVGCRRELSGAQKCAASSRGEELTFFCVRV